MAYVQKDLPVANFPEDPPNLQEYMVPPKTNVPSVIGLTAEEAESRLRSAKLNVTIEEINSPEPEGIVVNQSLEPGASVNQGTYVTIYVSTGKPPVGDLPNLLGLTVEEALAVIDDFELETGLQINFFQQKKATNKKNEIGKILDMDPPPGTSVTGSVQITLVVGEAKN
jgi:serine/threonine-protein kinase